MFQSLIFNDGGTKACVVSISCQLTQSYAPAAKTRGSFSSFGSSYSCIIKFFTICLLSMKIKDSKAVYQHYVTCQLYVMYRIVSCIVSWHLYRDMYRFLRKCIVAALMITLQLKRKTINKCKRTRQQTIMLPCSRIQELYTCNPRWLHSLKINL